MVLSIVLYPFALGGFGALALVTRAAGSPAQAVDAAFRNAAFRDAVFLVAAFQLCLVVLVVPSLGAGAVAGERERQTFDLLIMGRLSLAQIVYGNLVGSLWYVMALIAASSPVMLAVFVYARLGIVELLLTELVTILTVISAAALTTFISALSRRIVTAGVAAYSTVSALYLATALPAVALGWRATSASGAVRLAGDSNPLHALHVLLVGSRLGIHLERWQTPGFSTRAQSVADFAQIQIVLTAAGLVAAVVALLITSAAKRRRF